MKKTIIEKIKQDYLIFIILIAAAFLRLYHLTYQSAWLDEVHTLKESDPNLSFKDFDAIIMLREGIPHFYFLTIRFLSEIIGHGIFSCRIVSVIGGVAAVYFIYLVGKEMLNKNAGHIAAMLLTVNLLHIGYSQEARSYALLVLFTLISAHRLLLLKKDFNYRNAILFGAFSGLIPHAHPVGLLNIGVVYTALFFVLVFSKTNQERLRILKFSVISGICTIIVFSPVYQIITKVSGITVFWVPQPTLENITQVFVDIMGKSEILFGIYIVLIAAFIIGSVFLIFRKKYESNKLIFNLCFLLLWIALNAGAVIIKSYQGPISLILNRYIIGILPAVVLIGALALAFISNKIIRNSLVAVFVGLSLYNIVSTDYYTAITKTQFDKLTSEVIKNNGGNEKIYSSFGWLMSYYFYKNNPNAQVTELPLHDYIDAVRNNAVEKESFWYIDGNSRPYSLNPEDEAFIEDNYTTDHEIDLYDCWGKHYIYQDPAAKTPNRNKDKAESAPKSDAIKLYISQFKPLMVDGGGHMMLFENSTIRSPQLEFRKGKYKLTITGNSLPDKPIQGKNAHLIVRFNSEEIGNYFLSENAANKDKVISFECDSDKKGKILITFDNDIAVGKLDRNVILYAVKIEKE